jgi:hypothetical protein
MTNGDWLIAVLGLLADCAVGPLAVRRAVKSRGRREKT